MKKLRVPLVLLLVGLLLVSTISSVWAQEPVPQAASPDAMTNRPGPDKTDKLRIYPEDLSEFGSAIVLSIDESLPTNSDAQELTVQGATSAVGSAFVIVANREDAIGLRITANEYSFANDQQVVSQLTEKVAFKHIAEQGLIPSTTEINLQASMIPQSEAFSDSRTDVFMRPDVDHAFTFRIFRTVTPEADLSYWLIVHGKDRLAEVNIVGTAEMEARIQEVVRALQHKIAAGQLGGATSYRSQLSESLQLEKTSRDFGIAASQWVSQVSANAWLQEYRDGSMHWLATWWGLVDARNPTFMGNPCGASSVIYGCISQWTWWYKWPDSKLGVPGSTYLWLYPYRSYSYNLVWNIANYRADGWQTHR